MTTPLTIADGKRIRVLKRPEFRGGSSLDGRFAGECGTVVGHTSEVFDIQRFRGGRPVQVRASRVVSYAVRFDDGRCGTVWPKNVRQVRASKGGKHEH